MRLGISSDADRTASIDELLHVCGRRGLAALELSADALDADAVRAAAGHADVRLSLASAGLLSSRVIGLARELSLPLLLCGDAPHRELISLAWRVCARGVKALPLMRGPAEAWLHDVAHARIPFAWQIDDTVTDAALDCARILRHGELLTYVRLTGGGPEATMQEGRGIGAVMRQLALSGYDGTLILAPSSQRYRVVWSQWLGRRGWGCGSSSETKSLQLAGGVA
jgi:hypothetical protein